MILLAAVGTVLGIVLAALVAYAIFRADSRASLRLDQESRRADRELELRERELTLRERALKNPELPKVEEFPAAIRRVVERESEEWAREDAVRIVQEEWLGCGGDWEKTVARVSVRFRHIVTDSTGEHAERSA